MNEMAKKTEEIEVEVEEVEDDQPTAEELAAQKEVEDDAKRYGWKPLDDYDRAPDGWVDASRFMEFPSTQNKVLKDTKRDLEKRIEASNKEHADTIARIQATTKVALDKAREQERAKYDAELRDAQVKKREAAASQDLEAYDQATARERQVQDQRARLEVVPEGPAQRPPDPTVMKYRDEHEWAKDPVFWKEAADSVDIARSYGQQLETTEAQLGYADKFMRQKYPHFFQSQQQASRVEVGSLAGRLKNGKGADDLDPETRKVAKELVAEGIYKNIAEYAKDYWAQET